ncbi:hypothetical protein BH10CYA1_BH10CYA1_63420 [soil metagenome]
MNLLKPLLEFGALASVNNQTALSNRLKPKKNMTTVVWVCLALIAIWVISIVFEASRRVARRLDWFILGVILVLFIGLWKDPHGTTESVVNFAREVANRFEIIKSTLQQYTR